MVLWLKLLAFGLVLLDLDVFVTGQTTSLPSNGWNTSETPNASTPTGPQTPRSTTSLPTNTTEREPISADTTSTLDPNITSTKMPFDSTNSTSALSTEITGQNALETSNASTPTGPQTPRSTTSLPANTMEREPVFAGTTSTLDPNVTSTKMPFGSTNSTSAPSTGITGSSLSISPHFSTHADSSNPPNGSVIQAYSSSPAVLPTHTPTSHRPTSPDTGALTTSPASSISMQNQDSSPSPTSTGSIISLTPTINITINTSDGNLTTISPASLDISASTAPASITPAMSSTPDSSTVLASPTPKSCGIEFDVNIEEYRYNENSHSYEAVLPNHHHQNVTLIPSQNLVFREEGNKIIFSLKPCQNFTIVIKNSSCQDSFSKVAPPDLEELHFNNTVANEKANTSIVIEWNSMLQGCSSGGHLNLTCDNPGQERRTQENLTPNTNFTCTAFYDGAKIAPNKNFKTDFGDPERPQISESYAEENDIIIKLDHSINTSSGPIHRYVIWDIGNTVTATYQPQTDEGKYTLKNLSYYKNYTLLVKASTCGKIERFGPPQTTTVEIPAGKPGNIQEDKIKLLSDNSMEITCKKSIEFKGPKNLFILTYVMDSKNIEMMNSNCTFTVEGLRYLTTYKFTITAYNGVNKGDPCIKIENTKYNSQALITFLAFLIIVTSIALLIVLYKIYDLHKKRLSSSDECIVLVERDDDKQLMNVEPIHADILLETYKRKIADEARLFLAEFQSIPRVFTKFAIKDARKSFNQNKNRYVDILPYDYNRVELAELNGDVGSDYINASYVDGFKEPRKYIAAQGPKDETVDDFWRMIWERKVTIIVMVTRCEEGNRNKCAEYWPTTEENSNTYGEIAVKISDYKRCPDYIIQKFNITNKREKTVGRDVTHIQFTSWPDHGVPEEPHLLLKLRRRVNAFSNFFSGPIVVHCSAGVGRTGTYIGIDAMLEGLEAENQVDVYGYVVKLRRQRCLMVQVEAQYILIHQALVEYNRYGETEVNISELHRHLNYMTMRDPPNEPSPLEAEFQRLPTYTVWRSQNFGNQEENKSKNRNSKIIPYDYNRVSLKHELETSKESEHESDESSDDDSESEESSKYINASFITSYWKPDVMIAAQGPLKETVGDFWQMIFQRKVKVIVMLTDLQDGEQELCAQYWGEETQTYQDVEVNMTDVNQCTSYTIRAFELRHAKRKDARTVFQYQVNDWKGEDLPEDPKGLITMIQNLRNKLPKKPVSEGNKYHKGVPLLIHCRDGSQQTGTFCALLNLLESAETEEAIDVFQVVKSLRRARPGMVTSFEHYQFLYDIIASIYPAQNGQVKKSSIQEEKIEFDNEVDKPKEDVNSISTPPASAAQLEEAEESEDSKSTGGSKGTESSSNGPMTPTLKENA
ncbi:receptor-type tyrosine-protein phosphatase C isoform X4 [Ornithorhynchus anatinus]|uniref:receptor-type tyrosine-protein phosphatase C isoform X4 n=1 Tax=Ornithorhynchus anatinus TaxID=9258 RepID=UPI0010A80AC3|nr:receptor-type tyrosine-protein phosphatase C isoform X4 [Ornithorhynchus anatinus]